ncbi:enoyl-CoA hydratase/isomerase family protein [Parvularcula maris]|uniref:3-hydroxyisobutyryl-CoA hydrolase n=1 Tax=Parvularcula maris TaxID=2965077 RepID=A0A9X2RKT2_9PROT|nr:enoyl-CoA hydratase/isomerase family protein [Parvularcula maris]MCQ8185927.1 enoyl-CoA hydratase/isomerase family protein [Parvularcula maris]
MTDDIRFSREGAFGVVTLARPKALNSLTAAMCAAMDSQLRGWAGDDGVRAVLIEGEGERAFCAGGDIRWLATTAKEDPVEAATFFRTEYRLNDLIAGYDKPYIALIDGICMGGGVGVSAMADRRIATTNTLWAMPECGIGLVPDVGASYVLPKLEGGLPLYLGLTGARLDGGACVAAGVATHLVEAERTGELREALIGTDLSGDVLAAIDSVLGGFHVRVDSDLSAQRGDIDRLFSSVQSAEKLTEALRADGSDFAARCLKLMAPGSPTSQELTVRLLNGAPGSFSECITREFRVTSRLLEGPDFHEGVRAQIIDKDRDPKWQPDSLGEVTEEMLDRYFQEPEGGDLRLG